MHQDIQIWAYRRIKAVGLDRFLQPLSLRAKALHCGCLSFLGQVLGATDSQLLKHFGVASSIAGQSIRLDLPQLGRCSVAPCVLSLPSVQLSEPASDTAVGSRLAPVSVVQCGAPEPQPGCF